ncbi:MAG: thioredoxin [Planctomycetes bacterium]|nr:thioredoxin [Planctomycetota bacterium]
MAGDVLDLTSANFESEASTGALLVDFYATWCAPCKTIAPIVEDLATNYRNQGLKVGKVDIDQAADLAVRFGILGVPTLVFFKGGKKVDQLVGPHSKPVIEKKIKSILT